MNRYRITGLGKLLVLAFTLLVAAPMSLVAQTRTELEKKYGAPVRDKHNRWIFNARPDGTLMVIFKKDGNPELMKLAPRFSGDYLSEKVADEIIHELWSREELTVDPNGFAMSIATGCNQQEFVTYQHFTMKTFKGCNGIKSGIEFLEITWKKMLFANPKTWVLCPERRLRQGPVTYKCKSN